MRILVISQYYSPDITAAAFRVSETVELLTRKGHEVKVITAYPHRAIAKGDGLSCQEHSENTIYRVKLASMGRGGLGGYLLHYLSFVIGSIKRGILIFFKGWRPDVIWTTSPPLFTGATGVVLSALFRSPLVFDIRDIWPDSAVAAGQISGDGNAYRIGKVLEKKLYSRSNHLTCVSHPMAYYLEKQTQTPVSVVYNAPPHMDFSRNLPSNPRKRILYAGNLGRVQGLDVLIESFNEVQKANYFSDWKLEFIGAGAFERKLKNMVKKMHLEKQVRFHPPMTKQKLLEELANSGLLFINLKKDRVLSLTIPSKVFDYMLVNRPIIAGLAGEGKKLLQSTGANLCFSPNKKSLKKALKKASETLPELQKRAWKNSRLVLGNYSRERSTEKLLSVFNKVIEDGRVS